MTFASSFLAAGVPTREVGVAVGLTEIDAVGEAVRRGEPDGLDEFDGLRVVVGPGGVVFADELVADDVDGFVGDVAVDEAGRPGDLLMPDDVDPPVVGAVVTPGRGEVAVGPGAGLLPGRRPGDVAGAGLGAGA